MRWVHTIKFLGYNEKTHEVRIYDSNLSPGGTPTILTSIAPGYTIEYNTNIQEVLIGGILESGATITLMNRNNELSSLLTNITTNENRYFVEIYQNDAIFWRGVILSDWSNIPDADYGGVQLTAVDGLGLLNYKPIPANDTDDPPNKLRTLIQDITVALGEMPHISLFEDLDLLRVKTDWAPSHMEAGEPLEKHLITGYIAEIEGVFSYDIDPWVRDRYREAYNGNMVREYEPFSSREVIEHIANRFNAVFFQQQGIFFLIQRDLLTTAAAISLSQYSKTGIRQKSVNFTTSIKIAEDEEKYRASGQWNYLPGLDKVRVVFPPYMTTPNGDVNNLIPLHSVGEQIQTWPVYSGTNNYLVLGVKLTQKFSVPAGISLITYRLTVRQGAYYLQADGVTWATTAAYIEIEGQIVHNTPPIPKNLYSSIDYSTNTNDLPTDGEILWKLELVIGNPTYATYESTILYQPFVLYIVDNASPVGSVTFEAENTNGNYTLIAQLQDSVFGSAPSGMYVGMLLTKTTSIWDFNFTSAKKKWRKGATGAYDKYFNELLVDEVMAANSKNLLWFSGNVHMRTNEIFQPGVMYIFTYRNFLYGMTVTRMAYNPQMDAITGDWVEIHRERGTLIPPVFVTADLEPILGAVSINGGTLGGITQIVDTISQNKEIPTAITIQGVQFRNRAATPIPLTGYTQVTANRNGDLYIQPKSGDAETLLSPAKNKMSITYGFLYNLACVNDARGFLAPDTAFRVPTSDDIGLLGVYIASLDLESGKALKSKRQEKSPLQDGNTSIHPRWDDGDTVYGTDDWGVSILPAGYRNTDGDFLEKGQTNIFWMTGSEEHNAAKTTYDSDEVTLVDIDTKAGVSVALLRDVESDETGLPDGTEVTGYTGNNGIEYTAVKVGDYVLLTSALVETKFATGENIPNVTTGWVVEGSSTTGYCHYDNEVSNAIATSDLSKVVTEPLQLQGDGTFGNPLRFPRLIHGYFAFKDVEIGLGGTKDTWVHVTRDGNTLFSEIQSESGIDKVDDTFYFNPAWAREGVKAHMTIIFEIYGSGLNNKNFEARMYNITQGHAVDVSAWDTTDGNNQYTRIGGLAYDKNSNPGDYYRMELAPRTGNDTFTVRVGSVWFNLSHWIDLNNY